MHNRNAAPRAEEDRQSKFSLPSNRAASENLMKNKTRIGTMETLLCGPMWVTRFERRKNFLFASPVRGTPPSPWNLRKRGFHSRSRIAVPIEAKPNLKIAARQNEGRGRGGGGEISCPRLFSRVAPTSRFKYLNARTLGCLDDGGGASPEIGETPGTASRVIDENVGCDNCAEE